MLSSFHCGILKVIMPDIPNAIKNRIISFPTVRLWRHKTSCLARIIKDKKLLQTTCSLKENAGAVNKFEREV